MRLAASSKPFLKSQPVQVETALPALRVPARVAFREGSYSQLSAPLAGRVVQIHVSSGDNVKSGDPLVTLNCPEASSARSALATAEAELREAQAALLDAATRFFGTGRDGLPGNDDAGALSAWYVFTAMGFYPDAPGTTRYSLGRPLFRRVELTLQAGYHRGTKLVVDASAAPPISTGPARATLDGKPLAGPFLDHAQLTGGGTLAFGPP